MIVEEFDIANINRDFVLDSSELTEFINRMLDHIQLVTDIDYPRLKNYDPVIYKIMFELNKITSPESKDETGPEHDGITLMKMR